MSKPTTIDIDAIVRSRMGSRARWLPRFVTRWLEGYIHQDYINAFLKKGLVGVPFCEGVIEQLSVHLTVEGLEHLAADARPMTFVSNHPLGAIDGVTLGAIVGRHYDGRVKYLVNDLLMNLEGLAPLCVPVNKLGAQSRSLPQQVDAAFRSDNHIIMFPAGLCSRRTGGQIRDIPWRKAFIKKSIETRRDIVPVHFIAQNSDRFYRIAAWQQRLGIKFNIAMTLLPDEMYRSRGQHYTVRFGRPIPCSTFDTSRPLHDWAQWVQDQVYAL